ncbi:hypothetical protein XENOCAPTIV_024645, partial [Xenoophorus captivus]
CRCYRLKGFSLLKRFPLSAGAAGRLLDQPVGDWLEHVGLPQYESKLLLNGFDDLHYMGSNIMEDQDLREIGITDPSHRKKILHAARSLPKVKALGCDGSSSLSAWLENLGLHEYLPNFLASGYRSLDCVKNLWELEIVNVSHGDSGEKRIIASLAERPYEEPPVKPPRLSQIREQYEEIYQEPRLTLRPPSLAAYAPVQNWHHQPEKLIFEFCAYEAKHEIRNISCAAQDPEDLCTFAYITKDLQTSHHYCHVFSTIDVSLTYEIILTLGQAFEVAYQLALQAQRTKQHQGLLVGSSSDVNETKSSRPLPKPRGSVRKPGVSET